MGGWEPHTHRVPLSFSLAHLDSLLGRAGEVVWVPDDPRVVTALLQLHHDIDEARDAALHSFTQCLVVLSQNPTMTS